MRPQQPTIPDTLPQVPSRRQEGEDRITPTVFFHYDGASSRVIAETDGTGATLATYTYDSAGSLFSMARAGETYYYHLNARGDVVAMSDSSGAVVNTYAYDPWGTLLAASETVANPYRYASYRYDEATGLSYCWNRYYAPELARFLTRDIYPGELSDPVTMNPYLYCGGEPVNRVDPSGMVAEVVTAQHANAEAVQTTLRTMGLTVAAASVATLIVTTSIVSGGGMVPVWLAVVGPTLAYAGVGISAGSMAAAYHRRQSCDPRYDESDYTRDMVWNGVGAATGVGAMRVGAAVPALAGPGATAQEVARLGVAAKWSTAAGFTIPRAVYPAYNMMRE